MIVEKKLLDTAVWSSNSSSFYAFFKYKFNNSDFILFVKSYKKYVIEKVFMKKKKD